MGSEFMDKFQLPIRYKGQAGNVWEEFKKLALTYHPVDLGQGYPDFPAPENICEALKNIAGRENVMMHQYTRGSGHPRLVKALSQLYSHLIGRPVDPYTEIVVSCGAYGALFSAISGHVEYGDEIIIIDPAFDCYEQMIRISGGIPVPVQLHSKQTHGEWTSADWVFDEEELQNAFNSKTKAIILNTPHNPLGKVYSEKELLLISSLCAKWNVLCISDEVYEWLVYKPNRHIRIASLPGMWERTLTVGSAGKTFSVTGWKIGWAYGPNELMHNLQVVHQNSIYTCNTLLQEALAIGFEMEITRLNSDTCSFTSLMPNFDKNRKYMVDALTDLGLKPIKPEGGYFILADCKEIASKLDLSSESDEYLDKRFAKWLVKNIGVQFIPCTAFYSEKQRPISDTLVRVCIAKEEGKLQAAVEKLQALKRLI